MRLFFFLPLSYLLLLSLSVLSQEEKVYAERTFYDTRIINGHSVETNYEGVMKFIISHRFGSVSTGISDFFGLDDANMRLGFDYGIVDWLTIGVARSSYEKTYDAFVKSKMIRQSSGSGSFPLSMSFFYSAAMRTTPTSSASTEVDYARNTCYTFQLLLARKFSESVSIQIMPSLVHRNLVATAEESHDVLAIGVAPKVQISKHLTLNAEYYYVPPDQLAENYYNSFAIGIDIETKGHVFQLNLGNSRGLIEKAFIAETTDQWKNGDIHFGFNITRDFKLKGKKYRKKG